MDFSSDNAYGVKPEILAAISEANKGADASYGEDSVTADLRQRFSEIFERDVSVFPVLTGTAANALALATLSPSHGAIFCHEDSHIATDECGAPEFFSGGAKLVPLKGAGGKITVNAVEAALPLFQRGVHSPKPSVISITQATEGGTVYRPEEIAALSQLAQREGMALHMDGARFANAAAYLGCAPADIAWKSGVDALSFGGSKNGALCAEAVVFFEPSRVQDFEYRRKRAGHLLSKMRFVSAQLLASLEQRRWLTWAEQANELARGFAAALSPDDTVTLAEPVEANEVFLWMANTTVESLRAARVQFYDWQTDGDRTLVRLVFSCLTPACDVERLLHLIRT